MSYIYYPDTLYLHVLMNEYLKLFRNILINAKVLEFSYIIAPYLATFFLKYTCAYN